MRRWVLLVLVGVLASSSAVISSVAGASGGRSVVAHGPSERRLLGVSCVSTVRCEAVGTTGQLPLADYWNGNGWHPQPIHAPVGLAVNVNSVSCKAVNFCEAVGWYAITGHRYPLGERWSGGPNWILQYVPHATAGNTMLQSVSCATTTRCEAVGWSTSTGTSRPVAYRWTGTWTAQTPASPVGSSAAALWGVTCTTATACEAVGYYLVGATQYLLGDKYTNGWAATAQLPTNPAGAAPILQSISCVAATCEATGSYYVGVIQQTLGERLVGATWTVQYPVNPAGNQESALIGVSCTAAATCEAVGSWMNATTTKTLAQRYTPWGTQTSSSPSGSVSYLSSVSCVAANWCEAVGTYISSGNNYVTLAERGNGTNWGFQSTP